MANPYAGAGTGASVLANVRGDMGDDKGPSGLADAKTFTTWEVTKRLLSYTRPPSSRRSPRRSSA